MPAKSTTTAGVSLAAIEAALPRGFFVTRGAIARAFAFTKDEMTALIESGVFVAEYPAGKTRERHGRKVCRRARFVRTAVLTVARKWESGR